MKKVLYFVLTFILSIVLCACGTNDPHPLSVNFQTEEELLAAFDSFFAAENWEELESQKREEKADEFVEVLRNNTAIHHYFQKSDEAVALAYKLNENPVLSDRFKDYLWQIFAACNKTDWYEEIVEIDEHGWHQPFFQQGWEHDRPTYSSIINDIKYSFNNPDSVSFSSGAWVFMPPVGGYYERPFEILGYVEVRYGNGYGEYNYKKYLLSGVLGEELTITSSKYDIDMLDLMDMSDNGNTQFMSAR